MIDPFVASLKDSWWMIAFFLFCFFLYEKGLQKNDSQHQQLKEQLMALQVDKQQALEQQDNLLHQINSQSDLAWMELVLMKGLGMIPEGQKKIYFKPYVEDVESQNLTLQYSDRSLEAL